MKHKATRTVGSIRMFSDRWAGIRDDAFLKFSNLHSGLRPMVLHFYVLGAFSDICNNTYVTYGTVQSTKMTHAGSVRNASAVRSTYLPEGTIHHFRRDMSRYLLIFAIFVFSSACAQEEAAQTTGDDAAAVQSMDLRSPAPEDARIFFVNLEDGATVSSPFAVEFGLEGMAVVPAGTEQEFSGHHHLLIDQDELPALDMPIPSDSVHVHYGQGQTSTELTLSPGEHTLQIVLGNHLHIPHDPPVVSEKITVVVQ